MLKGWNGLWKPATTRTGPNDASGVVWALGDFLYFTFFFFNTN